MSNYQEWVSTIQSSLDVAREIVIEGYNQLTYVEEKDDQSPVTIFDKRVEEVLRTTIRDAFPNHGIVGEEYGIENSDSEYKWFIDPIDGTVSYINGIPMMSTLVALKKNQTTVASFIDFPLMNKRVTAVKSSGSYCNNNKISVNEEFNPGKSIVCHGDLYTFHMSGFEEVFHKLQESVQFFRSYTDAYGHFLVAYGRAAMVIDASTETWDRYAPALIIKEAGGEVLMFEDKFHRDRKLVISGNKNAIQWIKSQQWYGELLKPWKLHHDLCN